MWATPLISIGPSRYAVRLRAYGASSNPRNLPNQCARRDTPERGGAFKGDKRGLSMPTIRCLTGWWRDRLADQRLVLIMAWLAVKLGVDEAGLAGRLNRW
jgi:hypothetical protein